MMSKKQKARNREKRVNKKKDTHHLLFQKMFWKEGYANLLREHPYMKVHVSQDGIHKKIHDKVHDVPTPNGKECKRAYLKLLEYELQGKINVFNDNILERLQFLIDCWQDTCPATVAILKWQQDIIRGCN